MKIIYIIVLYILFNIMVKNENIELLTELPFRINHKYKIYVFDLDETLISNDYYEPRLFPDILAMLNFARENNLILCIASHNYNAEKILKKLNIDHCFDYILGYYDDTNKISHLHQIMTKYNVTNSDIAFFDDLKENTVSARQLGIKSILVDHRVGLTYDIFEELFY